MTAPVPQLLDLARRRSPAPVDDEERLIESALEHRMIGVVSAAHRRGDLPLSVENGTRIGMLDLMERHRHRGHWEAVGEVRRRLEPLGARVAVLKGIATEARWYDEMGERVCTDVDLLLAPGDLDRVGAVIEAIDPGCGSIDRIQELAGRGLLQHVDLRLGDTQIDLHFDPFKVGVPTRGLARIWDRTESLTSELGTITVLDPESELVLMLLHLNKDAFSMLGAMLDVRNIIERATIDWDRLRTMVEAEGLEVPVWSSLATVSAILELAIEVPPVGGIRARTWRRIWGGTLGGYEGRRRAPRIQRLLVLHARRRRRDLARELRRQLVPQRGLLEVAGRLEPGEPYIRYLTSRFRGNASGTHHGLE